MLAIRNNYPTTRFFSNVLDNLFEFPTWEFPSAMHPVHDVIENEKEFVVEFALAGVKKEDITVNSENGILTITAERKEVKDLNYNHKESFTGKYLKSFTLPDDVNADNINASLVDGILSVSIPKIEKNTKLSKKQIAIN